jgi:hypothetical protein
MLKRRAGISPRTGYVGLLAGAFLLLPAALLAQGFEGVVEQRSFELQGEALNPLLDAVEGDEEYEYDETAEEPTEEDELRDFMALVDKLLALPLDQVRAVVPSDDAVGTSSSDAMTLYLKGTKVRAEIGGLGGFGYFLMSAEKTGFTLVNPQQKFYVEYTPEAMDEALREMGLDPSDSGPTAEKPEKQARIRSLGVTKEINGVRADAYRVEGDGVVIVGWVTDEYGDLRRTMEKLVEQLQRMSPEDESDADAEDLLWEKGVPVLVQKIEWSKSWDMFGVDSYEVTEVVSVERKSLSGDLFKVPAGYTKKTLAELYGQG